MVDALEAGKPIICAMREGDFTTTGHYIVLRGVKDGEFQVNDPNSVVNSEKLWSYEQIEGQIRMEKGNTELQNLLKRFYSPGRAWSSYETCFVISSYKSQTGSAFRPCFVLFCDFFPYKSQNRQRLQAMPS